jgi:hypothetical protein
MIDTFRRLLIAGLAAGVIAGNTDEFTKFFDETTENARHLATAGDLRSIASMLDIHMMKNGRYPKETDFMAWMQANFKENPTLGLDHWQRPLVYETSDGRKKFLLFSLGPDGMPYTLDDLRITGP